MSARRLSIVMRTTLSGRGGTVGTDAADEAEGPGRGPPSETTAPAPFEHAIELIADSASANVQYRRADETITPRTLARVAQPSCLCDKLARLRSRDEMREADDFSSMRQRVFPVAGLMLA